MNGGKSISDIMGGDVYKNIVEIESLKEFCTRMNEILTKVTDYVNNVEIKYGKQHCSEVQKVYSGAYGYAGAFFETCCGYFIFE